MLVPRVLFDFLPPRKQERPDDAVPGDRDARHSLNPRSTEQVEENGLRVVVRVVPGCNESCPRSLPEPDEKIVPEITRSFLYADATPLCLAGSISPACVEGDSVLTCMFGNKGLVGVRFFAPETVVKMPDDERQPLVLQEKIEKDH